MQQKQVSINAIVTVFMLSALVFGFLAIGEAAADSTQQKSGMWVNKDYKINGGWSIEQRGDQQVISFDSKFKTKKGPDLKVFLSPQSVDQATGANATTDAVLVAALKNNNGAQEYVLPADLVLSDFNSLLIHCEAFGVLWGGTNL